MNELVKQNQVMWQTSKKRTKIKKSWKILGAMILVIFFDEKEDFDICKKKIRKAS